MEKPAFTPRRAALASISASSASDSQLKLCMPLGQRVFHFGGSLADARKDDLGRVAAGLEDAEQFAAGDDVEARAGPGQQRQHGQRRVGFHRVANRVRQAAERLVVCAVVLAQIDWLE